MTTASFGPWRAKSRNQSVHSAGSSYKAMDITSRDNRLHEQPAIQPEPERDKMAMRSQTQPDFVLGPTELKKNANANRHDPKAQRDRMNMFKRQLAANRKKHEDAQRRSKPIPQTSSYAVTSSTARSVVEALREQRLMDGREAGFEEPPDEIDASQISAQDWPFIYFVVALDQMPVAKEDADEYRVGKPPHTARERQRFLAARKRRIQQSREEMERIREANIDMGLRLEPIRPPSRPQGIHMHHPAVQDIRRRPAMPLRHPPTPISSVSSREFPFRNGDYILNHSDELSMEDLMCRGFSQWFSDNFSVQSGSQHGASTKGGDGGGGRRRREGQDSDTSTVELPDIQMDQRRRAGAGYSSSAPGSLSNMSSNKKVHFAEGLPFIKGSGIPTVPIANNNKTTVEENDNDDKEEVTRPETTKESSTREGEEATEPFQPPWSAPVTSRSLATMTPRSKLFKPMPIPKIDIVSEIYDELIVKTIQTFLQKEGYSPERFQQLRNNIMARLSATYPHLARHRAWRLVRRDGETHADQDLEDRGRGRTRPMHQGFFQSPQTPGLDLGPDGADAFLHTVHRRSPQEPLRPRWVPVVPSYRPVTSHDQRLASSMFMAIDGRHIVFTPRDEMRFKTCLPGATSDYRMAPLVLHEDKPVKTWTHVIPSGRDE